MFESVVLAILIAVLAGIPFMPEDEADQYVPDEVGEDSTEWIRVTTIKELEQCYLSQGVEIPWWAYTEPIGDDTWCEVAPDAG